MQGWFDAFRNNGGPTLYNFSNRTAVTGDVTLITFLIIFSTIYVAFLVIFPGIRKEKFSTFCTVTLSLFVGATNLVTLFGSAWHVAESRVNNTYRAFTKEKIIANLGVFIGLHHVNITLQAPYDIEWMSDIDFNEQFRWVNTQQMEESFREALQRGLPFPILTVAEYFATGQEGLAWGGKYRAAGYFAIVMLWTSFAMWCLMNLMLVVVPRYGALLMTSCGFLLLATVSGYFCMLPDTPLIIHMEGTKLQFSFGWCYWLVLIAGSVCLLCGVVITTIEIINPHHFSTILEVNYDTPYDRHVIIEDSRGKRYQKKKSLNGTSLEDPEKKGLGSRILRRLNSNKSRDEPHHEHNFITEKKQDMEMEEPMWRYPYRGNGVSGHNFPSSRSRDSVNSTISRELPPVHLEKRYASSTTPVDPVSMW